ncbi:MAG: zinc-ribbon domain-containing protein, partial [Sulfuricaulis sp.]|nr:zinc-ribbon domain-containing protein [Sulfuricaulis sp.]
MAMTKCKECGTEVSTKAKECPKCGAPVKRKTSVLTWLVAILLGLWVVGYIARGPSNDSSVSSVAKSESTPREVAMKETKLDFSWNKAGFGNVMEATFTVQNKSKYNIKDIT